MYPKSASDFRAIARDILQYRWGTAILVGIVVTLFCDDLDLANFSSNNDSSSFSRLYFLAPEIKDALLSLGIFLLILAVFWAIVCLFINGVLHLGSAYFHLLLADGEEARFQDLFAATGHLIPAFKLEFLQRLYIYLWSLLLVIPGIIKTYSYGVSEFVMVDHPDWTATMCMEESSRLMDGNKWRLFCLDMSFIGWEFLYLAPALLSGLMKDMFSLNGFVTTVLFSTIPAFIGQSILFPYRQTARAVFYRDLVGYEEDPAAMDTSEEVLPPSMY